MADHHRATVDARPDEDDRPPVPAARGYDEVSKALREDMIFALLCSQWHLSVPADTTFGDPGWGSGHPIMRVICGIDFEAT